MDNKTLEELLEINYKVNKSIIDALQKCCKDFVPGHGIHGESVNDLMKRAKTLLFLADRNI